MGIDAGQVVLVFDIGTQSTRAMLVDTKGDILGICQKKYEQVYFSTQADYAEQDADYYYKCLCEASKGLQERCAKYWDRIEAVSVTTMRDSIVCVDKEGKPLRPLILWLDKRTAKGMPKLSPLSKLAFRMVGMTKEATLQYQKSHCNWIRDKEPDIWAKTDKCLLLSGYLTYRLTGRMADAAASLVAHLPIDSRKRNWQGKWAMTRPVFPVEASKLCEVKDTGEVLGRISKRMSLESGVKEGLRVIAAGSDQACEILGLGCITEEKAVVGLGTTATVTFTVDRYVEPERFIPPFPSLIKGRFNPEIEIFRGYWLVSWFKKEFGEKESEDAKKMGITAEELLDRKLKEIPAGCDGLIFQPYFTPNVTMPSARGAFIGFTDIHTKMHMYRAIIEGINFALIDAMKLLEKRLGHKFKEVLLGGGASKSRQICQITADMFGIPTVRTQSFEVTGIGCAAAAFVGIGVFKNFDEAVSSMVHEKDRFLPDEKAHKRYQELYEKVFKKTYPRLKNLYQNLKEIYGQKSK